MSRWRTALEPSPELTNVVPALLAPGDPWAGDEVAPAPATYEGYLRYCPHTPPISAADHARHDAAFREAYRAVLDGRAPWSALSAPVAALGLDFPPKLDRRPGPMAFGAVTDGTLAEMCEDYVPDIGVFATERVLGPFSEGPLPRRLRTLSGAVMAFAPLLRGGVMPLARAVINKPKPAKELGDAIRATVRTPPMLWRRDGAGWAPAIALSDRLLPQGAIAGAPEAPAFVGRVVRAPDGTGWVAVALPLPALPEPAIVERRLMLELWRLRRHDVRVTWEDMLRERGEVLYRIVAEWCWLHHREAALALWAG